MQPKFDWLLNIVAVLFVVVLGGLATFWARSALGAIVMGIVFYGGLGFLITSTGLTV